MKSLFIYYFYIYSFAFFYSSLLCPQFNIFFVADFVSVSFFGMHAETHTDPLQLGGKPQ
jgi:hypothetical protein